MRTHPTFAQWKKLEEHMRKTHAFSPRNLNAKALAERYRSGMAAVAFDMVWNPVAYAALWKTVHYKTFELGKLFVEMGFRRDLNPKDREIQAGTGVDLDNAQFSHAVIRRCHRILLERGASAHIFVTHRGVARYLEQELGWTNRGFGDHAQRKAILRGEFVEDMERRDSRLHKPCYWLYYVSDDFFDSLKEAIRLYA